MPLLAIFLVLLLYATPAKAQWPVIPLLTPPSANDVISVENMPSYAPIYIYSTDERKFQCSKEEILHFLAKGKAQAVNRETNEKIWSYAPFTIPESTDENTRKQLDEWKRRNQGDLSGLAVATGALSTKNGKVYFWRKLNDCVLYIGNHNAGCYLILPKKTY